MKKQMALFIVAAVGALSVLLSLPGREASAQAVFRAAGPDAASIQGTVEAYRLALGTQTTSIWPGLLWRIPPSVAERSIGMVTLPRT